MYEVNELNKFPLLRCQMKFRLILMQNSLQYKCKHYQINPWTGREVDLENAEKMKQEELGTKEELFAVDLVN
jgi:hypothetical protein